MVDLGSVQNMAQASIGLIAYGLVFYIVYVLFDRVSWVVTKKRISVHFVSVYKMWRDRKRDKKRKVYSEENRREPGSDSYIG